MLDCSKLRWLILATVFLAGGSTSRAVAKDVFLTIGGGYDVTSTQLSLERNVIFQQKVLGETRPDEPTHVVLFADGNDQAPDVQCRDPEFRDTCPQARQMMAELMGDERQMDLVYRTNEIPNLQGPAELSNVKRQLRTLAGQLESGDRLIIYATGHGGPPQPSYSSGSYNDNYDYEFDEDSQSWKASWDQSGNNGETNKYDTTLYFYDGESVSASEFTGWLDRVPRDVQVVLVMVQCYAGGFSHTIFHQADADLGLSSHARCGFFAQVHDRGAAGCTPNANESEYEEYSSYFWGALAGRSRTGETLASADYDEDGTVSFAEAHAYAVIESNTIDIPIRTSDAFLRKYSNPGKEQAEGSSSGAGNPLNNLFGLLKDDAADQQDQSLVEMKGPLGELAKLAQPDQRAILEQLPQKLELGDTATVEDVQQAIKKLQAEGKLSSVKRASAVQKCSQLQLRVQQELRETWPELNAEYSPLAMALTSDRADEFVSKVESMASYEALCKAKEQRDKRQQETEKLSHREAGLQRLLHTCESIVLAANLPKLMPAELVDRYKTLVAMEEGGL